MHLLLYRFLHKTSETFNITISQKNDSLFIIMVTHYYVKHINKLLWKISINLWLWKFLFLFPVSRNLISVVNLEALPRGTCTTVWEILVSPYPLRYVPYPFSNDPLQRDRSEWLNWLLNNDYKWAWTAAVAAVSERNWILMRTNLPLWSVLIVYICVLICHCLFNWRWISIPACRTTIRSL
jgi:hypothetical protein